MSFTMSSESRPCTRFATLSASPASASILSNRPTPVPPGMLSPHLTGCAELPGITSATMPPSSPLALISTRESFGIGYSPSISSRISTPFCWIVKPRMRPMLTPCISTGSPLRMPEAFGTWS